MSGQDVDLDRGVDLVAPKEFIENRTQYYQAWMDTQGRSVPDVYAAFPSIETFVQPPIAELRASIGQEREVTFNVRRTGGTTNLHLNSLEDWQSADNIDVKLAPAAVDALKQLGLDNPRYQLIGKRVCCRGTLALADGRIVMAIEDLAHQFKVVDGGVAAAANIDPETELPSRPSRIENVADAAYIRPSIDDLRASVGREQTVTFRVQLAGGKTHIYLNSLKDYRQPDCFTVEVSPEAVASLATLGVTEWERADRQTNRMYVVA